MEFTEKMKRRGEEMNESKEKRWEWLVFIIISICICSKYNINGIYNILTFFCFTILALGVEVRKRIDDKQGP